SHPPLLFFFIIPPPPAPPLFPYTTLFRSPRPADDPLLAPGHVGPVHVPVAPQARLLLDEVVALLEQRLAEGVLALLGRRRDPPRSEEHTSELQSRSDLVCRLLLEKKKKKE